MAYFYHSMHPAALSQSHSLTVSQYVQSLASSFIYQFPLCWSLCRSLFWLYRLQKFNCWWAFRYFGQLHQTSSDYTLRHPPYTPRPNASKTENYVLYRFLCTAVGTRYDNSLSTFGPDPGKCVPFLLSLSLTLSAPTAQFSKTAGTKQPNNNRNAYW